MIRSREAISCKPSYLDPHEGWRCVHPSGGVPNFFTVAMARKSQIVALFATEANVSL